MASSILAGDRRWASARKSGMTVLGKVPKPINLPSQRLENNGLDPNVEIVPKGTLSWGQKPLSTVPNAWGAPSLLSPKTDGSTGSPSHGNGRPSSGGSGTRPSTASSDRSQDPSFNAWGPNSRPSSASGLLPSNHIPIVTSRPRSAETRPGSSQLSRFAENFGEPSGAWAATGTVQKLANASSRNGVFSLSSGDFPTLGSEKVFEPHIQRGHSSQGRPGSASGIDARPKEKLERPMTGDGYRDRENICASATDKDSYAGRNGPSSMKPQLEHQQAQPFSSINIRSSQFEPWHGPPVHSTDAVWYRGGATCGPYRPSGPPGTYSVDPFTYYPHQFPPSSESVPRPGSGGSGYRPINGESYSPQLHPGSYMVPSHSVIPARPGAYPGPLPYDGYYNVHQAGIPSSVEQQAPIMGVASHPGGYNTCQNRNGSLNSGQLEGRPGGHDPQLAKEQSVSDTAHSIQQAQYKVLLKQNDGWNDNHMQDVRGQHLSPAPAEFVRDLHEGGSKREGKQLVDVKNNEITECCKLSSDNQVSTQPSVYASDSAITNSEEHLSKVSDAILGSKPGNGTPSVHVRHPGLRKDASLIEKIEGLNNKVRNADSSNEVGHRPDKLKQPKIVNTKPDHSTEIIFSKAQGADSISRQAVPDSLEANASNTSNDIKLSSSKTVIPVESSKLIRKADFPDQRKARSSGGGVYNNTKSSSLGQVDDYQTKESSGRDSPVTSTKAKTEDGLHDGHLDCSSSKEAFSKEADTAPIFGSLSPTSDSLDYKAQRAKLKEIAAQRAKQLQKEEEERTREQKAKALAKLEELNKRSAAQSLKGKSNDAALSPTKNVLVQQDFEACNATKTDVSASNNSDGDLMVTTDQSKQPSDIGNKNLGASDAASSTSKVASEDHSITFGSSILLSQETSATEDTTDKNGFASRSHDSNTSRHRPNSYRRKQKVSLEKNPGEKPIAVESIERSSNVLEGSKEESPEEKPVPAKNMDNPKDLIDVTAPVSDNTKAPHNDAYVQHKKKNGRNSRNKNKMDEVTASSTLRPSAPYTDNCEECPSNIVKSESAVSETEVKLAPSENLVLTSESLGPNNVIATSSEQGLSKVSQEVRGRMSHHWRRSSRNQQGIRPTDKFHGSEPFIWAPVKTPNNNEQSEESSHSNLTESKYQSTRRNEQDFHNGTKTKRAEIERYVPKVVKELSPQKNLQQPSLIRNAAPDGMSEKPNFGSKNSGTSRLDGSSAGKTEFVTDTEVIEVDKPTRRGKAYTSWRQRISSESSPSLYSWTQNLVTDSTKTFNKLPDQHAPVNIDSLPEVKTKSDNVEGNNDIVASEPGTLPAVVKDHGATSKKRRQPMKIHRVAGNFVDDKCLQSDMDDATDLGSAAIGVSVPDARNLSRGENKNPGVEYVRTQWKPKSHPYASSQQQGNRSNGGRTVASDYLMSNKEMSTGDIENTSLSDSSALTKKDIPVEITNAGHREVKGNKKVPSTPNPSEESNYTLNQDVLAKSDSSPVCVSTKNEHQTSHVPRQYGLHSGRFSRGQEATYRGRDLGQDSVKRNLQGNGDKLKSNTHLEYKPVGSSNTPSDLHSSSNVGEEAHDVHHAPAHRYRERGHTQPRRNGHFFRRSNAAPVNVGGSNSGRE